MTNTEMLTRLEKLSTRALRRNAKAAEETAQYLDKLAGGELKPDCDTCLKFIFWHADKELCHECKNLTCPLASDLCREAARKMLAHVRRVKRLIGKAIEGRVK